jgi:hypothetical protein
MGAYVSHSTATTDPCSNTSEHVEEVMKEIESYDGSVESFMRIVDFAKSSKCETKLGNAYKVWKLSCLYAQLTKSNNDLGYQAANIISDFSAEESRITRLPEGEERAKLLKYMYLGTRDKKYKRI